MVTNTETVIVSTNILNEEIDVNFKIYNWYPTTREYRAYVYSADGKLLNKEPDLRWENITPAAHGLITVTSAYDPEWNVNTIHPVFQVAVFEQGGSMVMHRTIDLSTGTTIENPNDATTQFADSIYSGATGGNSTITPAPDAIGAYTPPPEEKGFFDSFLGGATTGVSVAALLILAFMLSKK